MTALPARTGAGSITDAALVNSQQKNNIGDIRDFIATLFGTNTDPLRTVYETFRLLDPAGIYNLSLVPTIGSNALTVNVKTRAGAVPTSADPAMVGQRSVTPGAGDFNLRAITAALGLTISSGSTLGHGNSDSRYIYWYLIDNAGAQELAVSSKFFGLSGIASTTAEGGAGAADSATVMYSATARSNVPFRCVGRMQAPQTTAGTWATLPSSIEISAAGFVSEDAVLKDGSSEMTGDLTLANNKGIKIKNSGGSALYALLRTAADVLQLGGAQNSAIEVVINALVKATFDTSGRLGVGRVADTEMFESGGGVRAYDGTRDGRIRVAANVSLGAWSNHQLDLVQNAIARASINTSGIFSCLATESQASSGYVRLPSGIYIQWGASATSSGGTAGSFPITFPTAAWRMVATPNNGVAAIQATINSTSGFTLTVAAGTPNANWIAIGN